VGLSLSFGREKLFDLQLFFRKKANFSAFFCVVRVLKKKTMPLVLFHSQKTVKKPKNSLVFPRKERKGLPLLGNQMVNSICNYLIVTHTINLIDLSCIKLLEY